MSMYVVLNITLSGVLESNQANQAYEACGRPLSTTPYIINLTPCMLACMDKVFGYKDKLVSPLTDRTDASPQYYSLARFLVYFYCCYYKPFFAVRFLISHRLLFHIRFNKA